MFFRFKMLEGWIKLHRVILESVAFKDEGLLKVFIWCILKASHKKNSFPMKTGRGVTIVECSPGQFVFGRKKAADELDMPESTVRNRMKKLQRFGNISLKSGQSWSIVTVCNWLTYQDEGQITGQPKDNQRTTKGQPKDTYKNVNNINNDKNRRCASCIFFKSEVGGYGMCGDRHVNGNEDLCENHKYIGECKC